MQPPAASKFYAQQQRVSMTAGREVRATWRRHMGDDFDSSWRRIEGSVLTVIAEGQAKMALASIPYLHTVLAETDLPDQPVGELRPSALTAVASDGRSLESLAYQSVVTAKTAVAAGVPVSEALDAGGAWLSLMTALQVADAARVALGVGVAAREDLGGYVRVLNLPVCQRCAVLGGRVYRWSKGFDRHPRDDCTMVPVKDAGWARAEGFLLDPAKALADGQIKDLTEAQTKALAEGADLSTVVNAYRGMSTTATSRPTQARHLLPGQPPPYVAPGTPDLLSFLPASVRQPQALRLTPEGIYQLAGDDRGEAIRLLRQHGFLT